MSKTIATAAHAMLICAAATLGYSASAGGLSPPTYVVRFHDLDVSKMDGAVALYARIRHAASVVCEQLENRLIYARHQACVNEAIADAVAKVNRPLVSQYHQLRTKGDKAGLIQLAKAN